MDPATIALIISALVNAGSAAYNAYQNKKSRQQARELQEDAQAHEELMQERQMEYNSYPNQVAMQKEAGLNPAMLYSQVGGATAASTGSGAMQSVPHIAQMDPSSFENPMQAAMQVLMTKANISQSEAMAQKTLAELPYIDQQTKESLKRQGLIVMQTHGQRIDNAMKLNDLKYRDLMNQLDAMAKKVGIDNVSQQTKNLLSEQELTELQTKYTQVQINQAVFNYNKEKKIWDECSDYIIRGIKEETRGKVMEAEKLFYEAKELMYKTGQMDEIGAYTGANGFMGTGVSLNLLTEILAKQAQKRKVLTADLVSKFKNKVQSWFGN